MPMSTQILRQRDVHGVGTLRLISINVGKAEKIQAKSGLSGIYKRPIADPVHVGRLGLSGDVICDADNHGGLDQAVYVYGSEDYQWWAGEMGQDLLPGTFGENLTVDGFLSSDAYVGDCFHIGEVVLQVTFPRIPCVTLSARMDDRLFAKRFLMANRPGVYCRVVREGTMQAPQDIVYRRAVGRKKSVLEMLAPFKSG